MKRLSVPARIIIIVYLVIAFFMLIDPPFTPLPAKLDYTKVQEIDYARLFLNILALTVAAACALVVSSLMSYRNKGKEKEEHGTGKDNV